MHEIAYDETRSGWAGYVWCATTDEGTQHYYWSLSYTGELEQEVAKDELFGSGGTVIPDSQFYNSLEEATHHLKYEMDRHAPVATLVEVTVSRFNS
ncbi:MAG TPA: hypothetical protein VF826_14010 [Chloroflexia bacterium]|jgi:hypothetical protein